MARRIIGYSQPTCLIYVGVAIILACKENRIACSKYLGALIKENAIR